MVVFTFSHETFLIKMGLCRDDCKHCEFICSAMQGVNVIDFE